MGSASGCHDGIAAEPCCPFVFGFGPKDEFATGVHPTSVEIGDLNGDVIPDLTTANQGSGTVSVLLGNGDGSFQPKSDFATGTEPTWAAIGDLNGDGNPDLAVTNQAVDNVSVLLNTTPAGTMPATFAPKSDFATANAPTSVAIGDLNDDGKPDLAVTNQGSLSVSVLLNTTAAGAGAATFAPRTDFATGGFPFSVAIEDLNADGKPDLATANYNTNSVSVLRNTTATGAMAATFAPKSDFATGDFPYWAAIGDLDNDGKPDLAVANNLSSTASVLLSTTVPGGSPTFSPKKDFPTGNGPTSLAIMDVTGDGRPDVATANFDGNRISVLLGKDADVLGAKADFRTGTGTNPQSVAIGDLNGDGRPDLASANFTTNTVAVLLSNLSTTAVLPQAPTTEFVLGPVAPNPSYGSASVQLALPREALVRLRVLDIQGRSVAVLADRVFPAGRHDVTWDGRREGARASAGIYFLSCEMGGRRFVRRVAMTR